MPLDQFIAQTSDPIYWSVIATALIKSIWKTLEESDVSQQDQGIFKKRIQELGEVSRDFISKAYAVNQDQTIVMLKEARIRGFSIIGEYENCKY